jgi:hypothetical protein
MLQARYRHTGNSTCSSCRAPIEWWITTHGRKLPCDPPKVAGDVREEAIVHGRTCTSSASARREKAEGPKGNLTEAQTPELVEREASWFAQRHSARAVLVLCDGTLQAWAIRDGENAEDLRMDLITLVNAAKRWLEAQPKGHTR